MREEYFLAWDDDSSGGLAAALDFTVPADGDYRLLIGGALSSLGRGTAGDFNLSVGVNAPAVLTGKAQPTGATVAEFDAVASPRNDDVEVITGTLTAEQPGTFYTLETLQPQDTFYARVEALSGDLRPVLVLRNFADKPIRSGNLKGEASTAALQYTAPAIAKNYQLQVIACCEDQRTSGDFRLVVGVNASDVLTGQLTARGASVVQEPIPVAVGLRLLQIAGIDQREEIMSIVAALKLKWLDPTLAFNPEECQCAYKVYNDRNFNEFLDQVGGRWPEFTIYNQQGNRWVQNRDVTITADGEVSYFERFTTDVQVDFDFRRFPFDTENFQIVVDAIFPQEYYHFTQLPDFSVISPDHGEDEFIIGDFTTAITDVKTEAVAEASTRSRFVFAFSAPRHLDFYVLRFFVPIMLITLVSWFIFFLKDYTQRIEAASANLLLFIAFSFSIADNYPRLGYMTFLDGIMTVTFIINTFVVLYNVLLRRMETRGNGERADRIDRVMDWAYPLFYVVALGILMWMFF